LCFIEGNYYFGTAKTVTINVTPCEDLLLDPVPNLPDATAGVAYAYDIEVSGSVPFTLSNITKPSWMTVEANGSFIKHYGTPAEGDVGEDIEVSYTISNCGEAEIDIDQTIDVIEPAPQGSILFTNSVSGASMNNVFPFFYSLENGNFPIANGGSANGIINDDFEGVVTVQVTLISGSASIHILLNGDLVDIIPVSGSGFYDSTSHTFAVGDEVEIKLVP